MIFAFVRCFRDCLRSCTAVCGVAFPQRVSSLPMRRERFLTFRGENVLSLQAVWDRVRGAVINIRYKSLGMYEVSHIFFTFANVGLFPASSLTDKSS